MAPRRDVPSQHVPFKLRLRELRENAKLSQERLAFRTYDIGPRPVSLAAIRKYEKGWPVGSTQKGPTARAAEIREIYVSLARALEIEPEEFAEYRLCVAREALDEAVVGLDVALTTLELIEAVSPPRAKPAHRKADAPPILPSERSTRTGTRSPRSRRAAS